MRASSDLSSLFEGTPTQKTKDAAEGATSAADGAAAEEVELVKDAHRVAVALLREANA